MILNAALAVYDWLVSLFHGRPGWYDPICSACGRRHAGRVRTDGREYIEYNDHCSQIDGRKNPNEAEEKGE